MCFINVFYMSNVLTFMLSRPSAPFGNVFGIIVERLGEHSFARIESV